MSKSAWSRADRFALIGLVIALIACVAAVIVVPEVRFILGLQNVDDSRKNTNTDSANVPIQNDPLPKSVESNIEGRVPENTQNDVYTVQRELVGKWSKDWAPDVEFTSDGRCYYLAEFEYRIIDRNHVWVSGMGILEMNLSGDTLYIRWRADYPLYKYTRVK